MVDLLRDIWVQVVGVLTFALSVIASGHAVLHKRDGRAATSWVAVIWLAPIAGPILYLLLGINRIRRRATELRRERLRLRATTEELRHQSRSLDEILPPESRHLAAVGQLVDRVTRRPLCTGNRVQPLINGENAYPAMLDAISQAEHTIALCTYIFDRDEAGAMFGEALEAAVRRHVEVRVLIDSVGARYSWPSMVRELVRRKVPVARFLHSVVPWRMPYMNLRSHRKILVVDGRIGFTGGMNIRAGHLVASNPKSPVQDVHFRVEGPVVGQMMNVFAEDWGYTTRELIDGEAWFPGNPEDGPVVARGIPDGPDRDLDNLRWTMLGALARAHTSVRIVTPYFLPDMTLITSLNLAAMRGVRVQIVLPEVNNLPVVKWASMAQLWQMLLRGCEIYLSPPPFDHSKIMVVDDTWTLIGSANWDPRSLRLNFEYNLECYDAGLATSMSRIVDEKIATARSLSLAEVDGRSFPIRLRDSTARLFAPYL